MEWKEVRLGEIASMKYGKLPPKDVTGPIPVHSGYRIVGWSNQINCKAGTVVVIARGVGGCGDVKLMKEDCFLTNLSISVEIEESVCLPSYFYYLHLNCNLAHLNSGSAQPQITIDSLNKYTFKLPDLATQRRISSILSSLDRKIELNNKINATLEEMAQALFKSWFVDFEPFKNGNFIDTENGKIPEGWRVGTLGEVGDIVGGSTPSKVKSEFYTESGIPWLTPKDLAITHARFTARGEIDITEAGYKSTSTKLMPRGSVLFSSRAPIGYVSIAKNEVCTNQGFKSVVPKLAGTAFIYCFLKAATPSIESKASGSTFKEASGALMKSIELAIAPKSVFDDFEKSVMPLFKQIETIEEETLTLTHLRDTLLPRLMSGEIEL